MFKNLRTSTKLFLLCSMFVAAIALTTYSLIKEKLIAIEFVRKELVGTQSLDALRGAYAVIMAEDGNSAQSQASVDAALDALANAERETAGSLHTAALTEALVTTIRELPSGRKLPSGASDREKHARVVEALAQARDLAGRIGDESKLSLDPDLDSYYLQIIAVKRVPALLSQMGELQSLIRTLPAGSAPDGATKVRLLLLDGMVQSTLEEIERDAAAAYRGDMSGRLKQTFGGSVSVMNAAVNAYLEAAKAAAGDQASLSPLAHSFEPALETVVVSWAASQAELARLLNARLSDLLAKLRRSLALIGLFAGLSLLLAAVTYRQLARPLRQLEDLATKVRETKDYGLRSDFDRRDEIGQLAFAFNAMLAELAASREREAADQARTASMQAEVARVSRFTTMGELAASIAHEVNQPLAAIVNNANAGLRWLKNSPPNIEEVELALRRLVKDGDRCSDIIASIRAMLKKGAENRVRLDLNELIHDVMMLTQREFQNRGVSVRSELANDVPRVVADRVQLQQVLLNLFMNAVEAMASTSDRERLIFVRSDKHDGDGALIVIEDSGHGIDPENLRSIFDTFFTTKSEGMGMGLSICRSIVESHGGRITASHATPCGSVFQIILPGEASSGT